MSFTLRIWVACKPPLCRPRSKPILDHQTCAVLNKFSNPRTFSEQLPISRLLVTWTTIRKKQWPTTWCFAMPAAWGSDASTQFVTNRALMETTTQTTHIASKTHDCATSHSLKSVATECMNRQLIRLEDSWKANFKFAEHPKSKKARETTNNGLI